MSLYPKFRDVHLWVGLILMLPVMAISGTGIILNHEQALGLKGYTKPAKTAGDKKVSEKSRPKSKTGGAPLATAGLDWSAYQTGVDEAVAEARKVWKKDVPLERIELKNEPSMGLVLKVKAAQSANMEPDEIVWSVAPHSRLLRPEDKAGGVAGANWAKVAHDLHTGKIFSKMYGFFWSDITAGALSVLSLTGVVLYAIPLMKKAAKKNKKAVVRPAKAVERPDRQLVGTGTV